MTPKTETERFYSRFAVLYGDMWRYPDDVIWALRESAREGGMCPNAEGTVGFLRTLESEGWMRESAHAPYWSITDRGREILAYLQENVALAASI